MWRLMLIPRWARFAIAGVLAVVVVVGGMLVVTVVSAPPTATVGELAAGPAGPAPGSSVAPSAQDGSGLPEVADPADPAAATSAESVEIPKNSMAVSEVPVAQRAPRIPLPTGSKQHDFAPSTVDLSKDAFVYASTPLDPKGLEAHLAKALPGAGWKLANRKASATEFSYSVLSPEGFSGVLLIQATPPGVPGHRSQVIGTLARPASGVQPTAPTASASPAATPGP